MRWSVEALALLLLVVAALAWHQALRALAGQAELRGAALVGVGWVCLVASRRLGDTSPLRGRWS